MTQLDPRSLIAMAGLMAALMAVVLYFMRRYYPPSIQGIGYWASAPLMWLVATVMFSGRGVFPDLFSMVVANTLLLLGTTAFYVGCRRFLGHGGGWRLWGTVAALSALVFAWLTYGHPSYPLRLGSFTALMICIYAANLRFLLCHGGKRFPVRLVEVVLALHIAVLAVRLSSTLVGRAGSDLMEPSLYQTLYIGAYVLTVLMLSIGAVLMATDRLTTELNHLATHDALTHTLNRRALLERFEEELARSQRTGKGPSLMMLDLDHFKAVNDTRGHQHGDAVLVHFVQRAQAVLRRPDRLGRYGGEEFVVLLPETGAQDAQAVAQRIHAAAASGHALDCRLSIGLTTWLGPQDTLDAMLARADKALYQAKAQGRNQTCVA
ncbi:MAG: diguanylate cyclase [Burkholderiales bacterium RIFCSPLOWO2_12_FULL_65_40]|nr:MAG: diguanylate cyclase [Burkholderiales bacterium RIFCSPLOWO2_12_FULL_65_40]